MEISRMFSSFTYNGQNSLADFNLYLEIMPVLPVSVANGVEQITMVVGFETDRNKILRIREWLSDTTGKLSFSFDDRTWSVTNVTAVESSKNKVFTIISIAFEVESQCLSEEHPIVITDKFDSILIYNRGIFESYPLITIEGFGNISLNLNDIVIFTIENVNGQVTLDSDIQECWMGNELSYYSLKNSDLYGDFPIFERGMNRIAVDSTLNQISKVIINPRWKV